MFMDGLFIVVCNLKRTGHWGHLLTKGCLEPADHHNHLFLNIDTGFIHSSCLLVMIWLLLEVIDWLFPDALR